MNVSREFDLVCWAEILMNIWKNLETNIIQIFHFYNIYPSCLTLLPTQALETLTVFFVTLSFGVPIFQPVSIEFIYLIYPMHSIISFRKSYCCCNHYMRSNNSLAWLIVCVNTPCLSHIVLFEKLIHIVLSCRILLMP